MLKMAQRDSGNHSAYRRKMKLFEFEAKNILQKYGIATPKGDIASNSDEAEVIAKEIGKPVVLKSQVLVSGRGKFGGILFADDTAEGGIDIEETALTSPDRISRYWIDP